MHTVQVQSFRIGVVFALLAFIGAWQSSFVLNAIGANPALNLVIFGTFFFGVTLVATVLFSFANEFRALYALMELYDDVRNEESTAETSPLWRFYRCARVGIVFHKPKIMGHAYQLISDQLHRDKELQVSAATMQTLVMGIEERLRDSRALISYVAGALIFLGLIGTFIGLMVTLASVGNILGSLDLSAEDPSETVAALMNNLQLPLSGMATGFSSSLFGLVTSLTLSVMLQLLNKIGGALKGEFSDWISNAVDIAEVSGSGSGEGVAGGTAAARIEERRLSLIMRTARHSIQATSRQARALKSLTESVDKLAVENQANRVAMGGVTEALGVLGEQNKVVHNALSRSVEMVNKVTSTANIRDEVSELTALLSTQMESRENRLDDSLRHIHERLTALATMKMDEHDMHEQEGQELAHELAQHADELNLGQINKLLATMYREDSTEAEETPKAPQKPATGTEG